MVRVRSVRQIGAMERTAVLGLVHEVTLLDGARPLSDHLWLDLATPGSSTYVGLLAESDDDGVDDGRLIGYAQLLNGNGAWSLECVVAGASRQPPEFDAVIGALLDGARAFVASNGGGQVNWWALSANGPVDAAATAAGFTLGRELHQMRRPLPLEVSTDVTVRAFDVGRDEAAWLRVNNAAFTTHPEQGGWTADTLAQRRSEPWFDPNGFLLHERDGVLAAFCWTKVHATTTPPMGEIYAIAVDPAFHGLGLGKALTIAGLEHLADVGLRTAMLYVDADNTAAVGLYERLGFVIDHTDRAFLADIAREGVHS
jgi:mycothiol synthase